MNRISLRDVAGIGLLMVVLMGCEESAMKPKSGTLTGNCLGFEHIGLNVRDPVAAKEWYCKNLGMTVVREPSENVFFVADAGKRMMLELYHNPKSPVPDYESIQHLSLHISYVVDNLEVFRTRLIAAGARPVGEIATGANGDKVANLRDPWGVPIQFVERKQPMLSLPRR